MINKMGILVDGDRRYLPLENGYFTQRFVRLSFS
jgi:hypothetical protein